MDKRITVLSAVLSVLCVVAGAQVPPRRALTARRASPPSVLVIPSSEITKSPSVVGLSTAESPVPARRLAAPVRAPGTNMPNMDLEAAPEGKLDITVTPAKPAFFNRAYLRYDYPRRVYITTDTAYAEYSKQNIPGFFRYSVRLDKGKKYLLELTVTVEPKNGALAHSIGGQQSQHILGAGLQTISTTVELEDNGWVSGTLQQSNASTPESWRVFTLTVREL